MSDRNDDSRPYEVIRPPHKPRVSSSVSPWLLQGTPGAGRFLVFGFHYAGTGAASSYYDWPEQIGDGALCPIQPPGREGRIVEAPAASVTEFAGTLAPQLLPYLDRPYAFVGHCGAFPYQVETAFSLARLGAPAPTFLVASSWGPVHTGLYGRLNFTDLATVDLNAEIDAITTARSGRPLPPELRELAAETLMGDLRVLRAYRFDGENRLPWPVLVVTWSGDTVVRPAEVWPNAWHESCVNVSHREFEGDHWEFLRAPEELVGLIVGQMERRSCRS